MKKTLALMLVGAAAVAAPLAHADWTRPTAAAAGSEQYAPGRLIVKMRPNLAPTARTSALRAHGARLERRLTPQGALLVSVPSGQSVPAAVAQLKRDPRVEYAEPDWRGEAQAVPNDALYPQQWGLQQSATGAWDRTTGSAGVKVADIDSGITFGQ